MTRTQKLIAALLVSLGMASGVAFGQAASAIEYGLITRDDPGNPGSDINGTAPADGTTTNTTINSGYNDGVNGGTASGGNVVIRSLDSSGNMATQMTISSGGVSFSNASGGPVKLQGVANGTEDYDAVNYKQLKEVAGGVASVAAMANIPQIDQQKKFSMGAGVGTFQGQTATAIGASVRLQKNLVARASFAATNGNNGVAGVGVGYSW